MFWNDHVPPHFHAKYGNYEIKVEIDSGVVEGKFPRRSLGHVMEWYEMHRGELKAAWESCRRGETPQRIPPLE
jgi:Domain of unknown function (DUF4160)